MGNPELRFAQADGTAYPDWEETTLKEVGERVVGFTPDTKNVEMWNGDIPWMTITDLSKREFQDTGRKLTSKAIAGKEKKLFPQGSLIMSFKLTVGVTAITPSPVYTNEAILCFLPRTGVNKHFLKYRLDLVDWTGEGSVAVKGKTMNSSSLDAVVISLPGERERESSSLSEQDRIAEFFTTLDAKLESLVREVSGWRQYKQGLMQALFTQELRFLDDNGQPYPDWTSVKVGNITSIVTGLNGKTKEDFGRGKPYVPYKNIFANSFVNQENLDFVEIKEGERQNKLQYGDVLVTGSSETPEEVGLVSVINYHPEELYLNSFCFGLRPLDITSWDARFLAFAFRSPLMRERIVFLAQGSTRYNITGNRFSKIDFPVPCLEEQRKIADLLSVVDGKISNLDNQVRLWGLQKQGLMQRMFV